MSGQRSHRGLAGTFNIHHGAPPRVQRASGAPARAIYGRPFDVLAVQEIDRRVVRSGFVDQVAVIAAATGLHPTFARTRSLHPGGDYGHALFTATPPRAVEIVRLPRCASEPRSVIIASIDIDGVAVSVASTHLHNKKEVAMLQLDVVLDRLLRRPGPHLLLGDLNVTPGVVGDLFAARGFSPRSHPKAFPSTGPTKAIDWIVGSGIDVGPFEVLDEQSSDHRPVVAELSWNTEESDDI